MSTFTTYSLAKTLVIVMKKTLVFFLMLAVLCSCRTLHPDRMFRASKKFEPMEFVKPPEQYIISAGDILAIQVFANKGLDLVNVTTMAAGQRSVSPIDYLVRDDGKVRLPMLEAVFLEGRTLAEAEKELEKRFAAYIQEPFVTMTVQNRRVIVFRGRSEGMVVFIDNEGTNLIEVLAEAGGIGQDGKAYRIKLIRQNPATPENPMIKLIDLSTTDGIKDARLIVQAHDIIYVEPIFRGFSEVLSRIQPFMTSIAIISTVVSTYLLITEFRK